MNIELTVDPRQEVVEMRNTVELRDNLREGVVEILNTVLADEFILGAKTRNRCWNITGGHFHDLHAFFDAQHAELDAILDEIAQRVRAVGGRVAGSSTELLRLARLDESLAPATQTPQIIAELLDDHETVIRQLRGDMEKCVRDFGDASTGHFLTGVLRLHARMAWMLRAVLD